VRDAMNGVRSVAEAKGVTLGLKIDPGATSVYADRTALQQILSNLLENAIRYTARGSVTISTSPAKGGVNLAVTDTGTGIAPEHLHRIFERFYRADPGRARDAGGTGLGLAIVRHLVESHGGHVAARSTQGAGTTINLFFPTGQPLATAATLKLNHNQPGIPNEE
jgi:signal transduction histidine kinase